MQVFLSQFSGDKHMCRKLVEEEPFSTIIILNFARKAEVFLETV